MRTGYVQTGPGKGGGPPPVSVPPDSPEWITPQLIESTLRVWQPFYGEAQLSPADAVQILVGTGRLLAVLSGR